MTAGNFNMEDPLKQEKIRRGSHEYVAGEGKHGSYQPRPYSRQEYPKVMDRTPAPQLADFKGKSEAEKLFQDARRDWEEQQVRSIVRNANEEAAWVAANEPELMAGTAAAPAIQKRKTKTSKAA